VGSDPNPNPNRLTGRGIICKMTLTSIPDPITDPQRGVLTLTLTLTLTDPWTKII